MQRRSTPSQRWASRHPRIARADEIDAQGRGRLARRESNPDQLRLVAGSDFHSAHLHLRFGFQFGK